MRKSLLHDLRGEQKEQILITVDQNGKPIGTDTRQHCHDGQGITHMAFMAFVIQKDNSVILTKRSDKKSLWAHFWDASVVSHVLPGETVEQAARRRGKEELGLDVAFEKIGEFFYHAKHGNRSENEYCYILVGKTDDTPCPNPVEIGHIKSIPVSVLISKKDDTYTPWLTIGLTHIDLKSYL